MIVDQEDQAIKSLEKRNISFCEITLEVAELFFASIPIANWFISN